MYRRDLLIGCLGWVRHMKQAGFDVRVFDLPQLNPMQRSVGVG